MLKCSVFIEEALETCWLIFTTISFKADLTDTSMHNAVQQLLQNDPQFQFNISLNVFNKNWTLLPSYISIYSRTVVI